MTRTIAICNQKGGTGKTTTAINLATYFALHQKTALLLDLDPQGNATSGLGINKNEVTKSVYNILLEQIEIESIILESQIPNLWLAPSHIDLTGAEIELVGMMGREFRLRRGLDNLKRPFDFIMIDCPPSLGLLTINALSCASSVLIPVQCEYYALEGLSLLLNTINLIKENLNPKLELEGVVLTMADFRTNLTREVIAETRNYFKDKVYRAIIPRSIRLTEAPSFGKPIALFDKSSIGATKYEALACEIMGLPFQDTEDMIQEDREHPVEFKGEREQDLAGSATGNDQGDSVAPIIDNQQAN